MSNIFNYNNKLFSAFDKVINIFCLSLIWFMACIPVFTIGASCTALYYAVNKVIRHGRGYIWKEFWSSFRSNFKQATVIWLIFLLIGLVMGADWFIMFQFMKAGAAWGKAFVIFVVMLVFEIAIWLYVYPNIARFENTNKAIVKNAALMSFAHLPKTILMLVILLVIAFLVYLIPFFLFLHRRHLLQFRMELWRRFSCVICQRRTLPKKRNGTGNISISFLLISMESYSIFQYRLNVMADLQEECICRKSLEWQLMQWEATTRRAKL